MHRNPSSVFQPRSGFILFIQSQRRIGFHMWIQKGKMVLNDLCLVENWPFFFLRNWTQKPCIVQQIWFLIETYLDSHGWSQMPDDMTALSISRSLAQSLSVSRSLSLVYSIYLAYSLSERVSLYLKLTSINLNAFFAGPMI